MNFPSIQIYGNILSPDLLSRLDGDENLPGQKPKDFGLETSARVRDEISQAWSLSISYYKGYKSRLEKLTHGQSGESETRNLWISPLLSMLGYNLRYENTAQTIAGKTYHITDPAGNLDGFPVIVAGYGMNLEEKPRGLRMSPHALLQEYLNFSDAHLFGLVTNGRVLRLLRDSGRIIRLSYVEIDLERMFDEGLYADFAAFFRLFHASRMPRQQFTGQESIMEQYHLDALESGTRIRENLSRAVENTIKLFADGFLSHPANLALRENVKNGSLSSELLYRLMLRLVYRLLFLMVIEERNLVFPMGENKHKRRLSDIYNNYYSVLRLRRLTRNPAVRDPRFTDLWQGLLNTFRMFESEKYGLTLGIKPLNGELFGPDALQYIQESTLSNKTLLVALEKLMWFTNASGAMQPINYKLLNVEEFGSVYEGLLEYEPAIQPAGAAFSFEFVAGNERSASGSHYTPEELVQPLIKHSLDYLLDDREKLIRQEIEQKKLRGTEKAEARGEIIKKHLLSLKVADISCGSGHILLSAARRIAHRYACLLEESDQPSPGGLRHATRLVIKNCIYGVDKNPLAVELCKVALWLEAHDPGEPLSFLDHRIKCGDSIVGLAHREELENGIADEAFKTLPGDDSEVAALFRRQNKSDRIQKDQQKLEFDAEIQSELDEVVKKFRLFENLPERNPAEIAAKARAHRDYEKSIQRTRLKQMADTQVAQFFIPKTAASKHLLMTDYEYRNLLRQVNKGLGSMQDRKVSYASEIVAAEKRFFHWFIEFPEVFAQGGFDCLLGNPPYLGAKKIRGVYGDEFLNLLHTYYKTRAQTDLIANFILRNFSIINQKGFVSLITTNTVNDGDTRENAIEEIIRIGGCFNFAHKSILWPGVANLYVTLFTINKGVKGLKKIIQAKEVDFINSFFENQDFENPQSQLFRNKGKLFKGDDFSCDGFIIDRIEEKSLLEENANNSTVIRPLVNGQDLNDTPDEDYKRCIICFQDWSQDYAAKYVTAYQIVEERVKPERDKLLPINSWNISAKKHWWLFGAYRKSMHENLNRVKECYVASVVSKYLSFKKYPTDYIFTNAVYVLIPSNDFEFTLIQSSIHYEWARKYSSKLKTDLRYTATDVFETFPFPTNLNPQQDQQLETLGETYHEHRRQLMLSMQLGLTKTYNAFHAPEVQPGITTAMLQGLDNKTITKKYGKEVWNLWNHLQKNPGTCTLEEAIAGIVHLRELHVEMDNAVLEAYGWGNNPAAELVEAPGTEPAEVPLVHSLPRSLAPSPHLPVSPSPIQLLHNFYEVDYLPENDRIRYTIHPDARKEVLKRLLQLNHQYFEQEAREGKHKEETVRKFYEQKGVAVPEEVSKWFGKGKTANTKRKTQNAKQQKPSGSLGLFDDETL